MRQEPGVEVELVDGDRGELTVLVNGKEAARKGLFSKPSVQKVLEVVHEAPEAVPS